VQAEPPPPEPEPEPELDAVARLVYEQGYLKRLPRAGWLVAGVPDPESVADHSFRTGLLAGLPAAMEGADPARATLLALWHDTQETRTGDTPYVARAYVTTTAPAEVTGAQTAAMPEALRSLVRAVVAEYEAGRTVEALVARDADKLDCLAQALEYRAQGNADTQDWVDSSLAALRTAAGRRLAETLLRQPPRAWWERERG
jgi:putative hydrolase of HD superfamily